MAGKLKFWSKEESKADRLRRVMSETLEAMNDEEKAASHPSVHNVMNVRPFLNACGTEIR